jgi:hypothetical protein
MNELSNKILSELADLKNFFKNRTHSGDTGTQDPLDIKLFYLFEHDKSENTKKMNNKKRKYTS